MENSDSIIFILVFATYVSVISVGMNFENHCICCREIWKRVHRNDPGKSKFSFPLRYF